MDREQLTSWIMELDEASAKTLVRKNSRYASSEDAIHNFKVGGEIIGGTPAQACWCYMSKHLVALRDMVDTDDFSNREDFMEKCQDTINYIRFLWCIGNERMQDYCTNDIEKENY